jgi:hypothetical protein
VRPTSLIVALTSAARRIGSIPSFGIPRPFSLTLKGVRRYY